MNYALIKNIIVIAQQHPSKRYGVVPKGKVSGTFPFWDNPYFFTISIKGRGIIMAKRSSIKGKRILGE